jgi:hypothetical protein
LPMGRPLSEKAHCTSPPDGPPGCRGQATWPEFALAGRARSSATSAPKPQAAKPLMARDYICAMTLKSRNAATRARRRGALRAPTRTRTRAVVPPRDAPPVRRSAPRLDREIRCNPDRPAPGLARPKVREECSRWRLCQPQRPAAHRLCGDATFDLCSSARAPRMHPANTGQLINLR